MFARTLGSSSPVKRVFSTDNMIQNITPIGTVNALTSVGTTTLIAFKANEAGLFHILRATEHSKVTKVLSAFLVLFPYIEEALASKVTIMEYFGVEDIRGLEGLIPEALVGNDTRGESLAMLCIYILGPAYSQESRFKEQLTRRIKAIAASLQVTAPDSNTVNSAMVSTGWQISELPPVIDEVLGMTLCRIPNGTYDPDAGLNTLMSVEATGEHFQLSDVSTEILGQARLVYANYHSNSIHFIPAVYDPLISTMGRDQSIFKEDLIKFDVVRERVINSPYLGLRATLPECYQIRSFPCLVYCGLLYHQACLTDDNERKMFGDYKISEIKNHVNSRSQQCFIEAMIPLIPPPTTLAIVSFMQSLPLEKAEILIANKPQEIVKEILETLRNQENPGVWAQSMHDRENAETLIQLVSKATTIIKNIFRDEFENKRSEVDMIEDRAERKLGHDKLLAWKTEVEGLIDQLAPCVERLSLVRNAAQKTIKTNLLVQLKRIDGMVRGTSTGPVQMEH